LQRQLRILQLSYGDETRAGRTRTNTTDAIPNLNVRYTNAERSSQRGAMRQRQRALHGRLNAETRKGVYASRTQGGSLYTTHPENQD
jgi:hypothetical protein